MRRVAAIVLVAVALAGCVQVATEDASGPVAPGERDRVSSDRVAYRVDGCRLVEAVVPGDRVATEGRLPAGYVPVDYGAYWGGPETGDSAVSVAAWDCATYRDPAAKVEHAELFLGAYVEPPASMEPTDATPFYLFDVWTTNRAYASGLERLGWSPPTAEQIRVEAAATGEARALAEGPGTVTIAGVWPVGETDTGTFVFENHHAVADGIVRQRMAFETFPYRTAPVDLTVDGAAPLVDLVGDGTTRGVGYHGWDIAYDARVTLDGSTR